jgi:hypothetical protein
LNYLNKRKDGNNQKCFSNDNLNISESANYFFLKKEKELDIFTTSSFNYSKSESADYSKIIDDQICKFKKKMSSIVDGFNSRFKKLKSEILNLRKVLKSKTQQINFLKFSKSEFNTQGNFTKTFSQRKDKPRDILQRSKSQSSKSFTNLNEIIEFYVQNKSNAKSSISVKKLMNESSDLIAIRDEVSTATFQSIFLPIEPGVFAPLRLNSESTKGEYMINQILDLNSLDDPIRTVLK